MSHKESARPNHLRVESAKVDEILNLLDRAPTIRRGTPARGVRAARRIYDMTISLTRPGGSQIAFGVVTRNLGSRGIAFLHRNYVHVGTRFEASLPSLDGTTAIHVRGEIVRCRHVVNMIHEVAARFDEPIDLPAFVSMTPEEEQRYWQEIELRRSTPAEGPRNIGTALVVDAMKSQRAVAGVWLKRMGFQVHEAASREEALKQIAAQQVDLVVIDMKLGAESGLDVCRSLRSAKYFGIIIAAATDPDDDLRRKASAHGCDAFIAKPITARNLHEGVEEATSDPSAGGMRLGPVLSTHDSDEAMRPLIAEFAGNLASIIDQLAGAALAPGAARIAELCRSLKADGGALGFWQITQCADSTLASLAAETELDELQRQVNKLLQILRRVTVTRPAAPPAPSPATKPRKP